MVVDREQVKTVDIIEVTTGLEAHAIRGVLEVLGLQTRIHYIGNVKHLISLLQNPTYLYKTVILCCHGDQAGLCIPELAPELEASMPHQKRLSSNDLLAMLNLNDQTIINTGCCLGSEEFANSFLAKGAKAYLGITDYIAGEAIIPFMINLFYFQFCKSLPINQAFEKAQNIDTDMKMFKLWSRK